MSTVLVLVGSLLVIGLVVGVVKVVTLGLEYAELRDNQRDDYDLIVEKFKDMKGMNHRDI